MMPYRVLLIGLGEAGRRFFQVLRYIEEHEGLIKLDSVCDINPRRFNQDIPSQIRKYTNFEQALLERNFDLIIVCVNEYLHFDILQVIKKYPFRKVLCEKPLTETLDQLVEIQSAFRDTDISVNFVERYSPIVQDYLGWVNNKSIRIKRIEFFWGKYRFRDARPTIGVTSEISHPLDLILYLIRFPNDGHIQILRGCYSKSDFSPYKESLLDSINVQLLLNGSLLVVGHSSFIWEQRRRKIIIYLEDQVDVTSQLVVFDFDNPIWDTDTLTIYDISKERREVILQKKYLTQDLPVNLQRVSKIYKYIKANISCLENPRHERNIAWITQAATVQQVLEQLKSESMDNYFHCDL